MNVIPPLPITDALLVSSTAQEPRTCWYSRTSAEDNEWRAVCWSLDLGLFCAVSITGTGNRVMTSVDGVTWVAQSSAADNNWRGVCWSPELELFCAVATSGTGNRVMTSPDGVTWTGRTSAADNNWVSVCWSPELGLFCAVSITGTGNRVMTSPDGVTWTARTSAADNNWQSVCWSPELGLFCAVASSGTGNRVMTSSDGVTWTARTSAADNQWLSVCWSPELGLFCAVSITGTGNRVMYSFDGIGWITGRSVADNDWRAIAWSAELGLFVAISETGTGNRVMTSTNPSEEHMWNAATTYPVGATAYSRYTHIKYESLANGNIGNPLSDTTKWLQLGLTDKWSMFDLLRNTPTISGSPLTVVIAPGQRIDSIALLGLVADSVTITMDSAVGSPSERYYTYTENLGTREVLNWYDYFFEDFTTKQSVVLFDLPPFSAAYLTITLERTTGDVECGACVIGQYVYLGQVQQEAESDVLNFSTVTREFDGSTSAMVQRRNVPKSNQTIYMDKAAVNTARALRDALNATPAVWSGLDDDNDGYFEALLILGFYKRFSINLALPEHAIITLELEEI